MSDEENVGWAGPSTGEIVCDDRMTLTPELSPAELAAKGFFVPDSYLKAWRAAMADVKKGKVLLPEE